MPQERKKSRAEIPDDYQPLAGSTRPPVRGARLLGPVDPADRVTVTVLVRRRPGTAPLPDHHHWEVAPPGQRETLGVGEFTRRYGAAEEELDAVADFLASHGLTIHERHAGRSRVVAEGSAEEVGAAFGVALGRYEAPRRPLRRGVKRADGRALPDPGDDTQAYRGFEGEVHLPPHLHDVVTAVIGLDNRKLGAPAGTGDPSGASPLPPTSVASLYNLPNTGAAGQTIGLFAAADESAAFLPSDITEFINSLPAGYQTQPNVTAIGLTVNGTTYTNDTSIILSGTAGDSAYEITQDISTSAAVAQGCNINVYMTEGSEAGWEAFLNRAIVPDAGDNPPSVLSASWVMTLSDDSGTIGDPSNSGSMASVLDGLLQKAAARLITVFLPIGDWGADDADPDTHCHVAFPNSDPWATSCGGTIIGTVSGTPPNWDEWVWSDAFSSSSSPFGSPTADFGATGGGVSDTFPVPSWQTSAGVNQKSKNDDKVRRGLPDITGMVALTGFFLNGGGYAFTGTSCVAPLYAGMTACLNSALGQPVGFLNPTIYANATEICRDITHGNNDSGDTPDSPYYTAAVGWDACSGWGTVDGTKLLTTLIDTTVTQTFQFWVIKSTFGVDEVTDTRAWPNSFSLVLDGFAPYQVGTPVPAVGFSGAFFNLPGVSIALDPSGPRWQDPSLTYTPQRLEIPFDVTFTNASLTAFPSTGSAPVEQLLTGLITVAGQTIAAQTVFELVSGADPYFTNIDASADNVLAEPGPQSVHRDARDRRHARRRDGHASDIDTDVDDRPRCCCGVQLRPAVDRLPQHLLHRRRRARPDGHHPPRPDWRPERGLIGDPLDAQPARPTFQQLQLRHRPGAAARRHRHVQSKREGILPAVPHPDQRHRLPTGDDLFEHTRRRRAPSGAGGRFRRRDDPLLRDGLRRHRAPTTSRAASTTRPSASPAGTAPGLTSGASSTSTTRATSSTANPSSNTLSAATTAWSHRSRTTTLPSKTATA